MPTGSAKPSTPSPQQIFNAEDLQAGTGITTYYLGTINTSYIMSSTAFYSDTFFDYYNLGGAGDAFEFDFDVEMNRATTLRGMAIINLPVYSTGSSDAYWTVTLKKWDGTTATTIVTGTSSTHTYINVDPTNQKMFGVYLTVPTTTFKNGESIRISTKFTSDGAGQYWFYHDPFDTTSDKTDVISSTAWALLPIKIDV